MITDWLNLVAKWWLASLKCLVALNLLKTCNSYSPLCFSLSIFNFVSKLKRAMHHRMYSIVTRFKTLLLSSFVIFLTSCLQFSFSLNILQHMAENVRTWIENLTLFSGQWFDLYQVIHMFRLYLNKNIRIKLQR